MLSALNSWLTIGWPRPRPASSSSPSPSGGEASLPLPPPPYCDEGAPPPYESALPSFSRLADLAREMAAVIAATPAARQAAVAAALAHGVTSVAYSHDRVTDAPFAGDEPTTTTMTTMTKKKQQQQQQRRGRRRRRTWSHMVLHHQRISYAAFRDEARQVIGLWLDPTKAGSSSSSSSSGGGGGGGGGGGVDDETAEFVAGVCTAFKVVQAVLLGADTAAAANAAALHAASVAHAVAHLAAAAAATTTTTTTTTSTSSSGAGGPGSGGQQFDACDACPLLRNPGESGFYIALASQAMATEPPAAVPQAGVAARVGEFVEGLLRRVRWRR